MDPTSSLHPNSYPTANSSRSTSQRPSVKHEARPEKLFEQYMIPFGERIWFAALPLPLPTAHYLNTPRPASSSSSPSHRKAAVNGGQTSSPPPSSASSDSSGSDVELELALGGAAGGGDAEGEEDLLRMHVPSSSRRGGAAEAARRAEWSWFCIDDELTYLSFAHDFGPLNLSKVYQFCVDLHAKLVDPDSAHVKFVLYTSVDPQRKANAALLLALYLLIVERKKPWEAFEPIAEVEFVPFRDAGRCSADYALSIQDCLYGMYKALELELIDLSKFDMQEYCYYEQVQNGDFNWVSKDFIAFASPSDNAYVKALNNGEEASYHKDPLRRKRSKGYTNVLNYFTESGVKLVVRLNNALYDRRDFEQRGIAFKEMYFDDGTNPPAPMVREFLCDADEVIADGGVIAIHCKAGLGRTGCLIAAHLVYKYGFTAGEVIGFMRICRPGMVVGPQQQYIHHNHLEWVKWAAADEAVASYKASLESAAAVRSAAAQPRRPVTPPVEAGDVEMDRQQQHPPSTPTRRLGVPSVTPARHATAADGMTPCLQPRKTPLAKRPAEALDQLDESSSDLDDDPLGRMPSAARHTAKYRKSGQTERIEVETMLIDHSPPPSLVLPVVVPAPSAPRMARPVALSSPAKKIGGGSLVAFGSESVSPAANPPALTRGGTRSMLLVPSPTSALPVSTRKGGSVSDSRLGSSRTIGLSSAVAARSPSPTHAHRTSPSSRLPTLTASSRLPTKSGVKRLFGGPAPSAVAGVGARAVKGSAGSAQGSVAMTRSAALRNGSGARVPRKRRSSLSIADFVE